jgi:D-cysteine desulfhydrase
MAEVARRLEEEGHRPYVVPYGGSNPLGASGYVAAMEELLGQGSEEGVSFDAIVFPSSSGGTQAGLVVGATVLEFAGTVLGVSVDLDGDDLRRNVAQLATATAAHLGLAATFTPEMIDVTDDYVGAGYGVVSDLERGGMRTLARGEGILLDPVYTARAFGGLLAMIDAGRFGAGERVLFWHTGGTSGIFGYGEACL